MATPAPKKPEQTGKTVAPSDKQMPGKADKDQKPAKAGNKSDSAKKSR